jgi:membrane protein implicated in regulation of membrane protease activity
VIFPAVIGSNVVIDYSESSGVSPSLVFPLGLIAVCIGLLLFYGLRHQGHSPRNLHEGHALIGETGRALENIADYGQIYVQGEIWNAKCVQGIIAKDQLVEVVGVGEGLLLKIKPKNAG